MKEAGRELDALVAEKVMGGFVDDPDAGAGTGEVWFWVHPQDGVLRGEPYLMSEDDDPEPYWSHSWHRWKPSTNIAAAWQVVDMLYKRGFGVGVVMQHGWDTACECIVFKTSIVDDDTIHASADTAPHAICLAALAALGVEVTK
jgi:hypothetical protein